MSDASDTDDLDDVRERKREELRAKAEGDARESTDEDHTETGAGPDEPIHLDVSADFQSILNEYDVVLVDFYADWCGPCKMIEPVVADLAASTPAAVLKVDVDVHQQLAGQHGVRGVPTLLVVADGEVREQLVGVQDEARLRTLIDQYAS